MFTDKFGIKRMVNLDMQQREHYKCSPSAVYKNGGFWTYFEIAFVLTKSEFNRKLRLPCLYSSSSFKTLLNK